MKKNLIKGLLISSLLTSGLFADVYVSAKLGIMNFGGSAETEDYTYKEDATDSPLTLGLGYASDSDNKFGLYYKKDELAVDAKYFTAIDVNTFGIDGEIGFSSLKGDVGDGELFPTLGFGLGFGSADIDNYDGDIVAIEFDVSIGLNYKISSFEVTADLYRRAVALADTDNDDIDTLTFVNNGIELGINYRF